MDDSLRVGDQALVAAICTGDDAAFCKLVDCYSPEMLRFARRYTSDQAIAEDALQDAWLGVLGAIHQFEGRSSLRTWAFRIFLNRLRTRLQMDGRLIPFSALEHAVADGETALPPDRFLPATHPRWPGHWSIPPGGWGESPEEDLLSKEALEMLGKAVAALPVAQREVITLRDLSGWSAAEVCEILEVSESNQRVLLHRARSRIRGALEEYFLREREA